MSWYIERLNSTPKEYMEVDNDGFIAWTPTLGDAIKLENKASSDGLIRLLVDSAVSVQDPV